MESRGSRLYEVEKRLPFRKGGKEPAACAAAGGLPVVAVPCLRGAARIRE